MNLGVPEVMGPEVRASTEVRGSLRRWLPEEPRGHALADRPQPCCQACPGPLSTALGGLERTWGAAEEERGTRKAQVYFVFWKWVLVLCS